MPAKGVSWFKVRQAKELIQIRDTLIVGQDMADTTVDLAIRGTEHSKRSWGQKTGVQKGPTECFAVPSVASDESTVYEANASPSQYTYSSSRHVMLNSDYQLSAEEWKWAHK